MSVIDRTMRILSLIAHTEEPLGLSDLARAVDLPLTTVYRLTKPLLDEGMLERDEGGALLVGLRLWKTGMRYNRVDTLRDAANQFVHDLYEVTRAPIELVVLDGAEALVVDRIGVSRTASGPRRRLPMSVPIGATAGGLALIAHAGDDAISAARERARFVVAFDTAIRTARAGGVVRVDGGRSSGGIELAAPIRGNDGTVAAVSLIVPDERAAQVHATAVLVTARRISAALSQ